MKLPHVNKKPLGRKRTFVPTPFSHSALNLEQKNFTPQKNHSLFRSTSCFGVTKITTPIWLQKSWMCEHILRQGPYWVLKKDSAPIQFKFFELWKTKRRPIIAPAIAVRLFKSFQIIDWTYSAWNASLSCWSTSFRRRGWSAMRLRIVLAKSPAAICSVPSSQKNLIMS